MGILARRRAARGPRQRPSAAWLLRKEHRAQPANLLAGYRRVPLADAASPLTPISARYRANLKKLRRNGLSMLPLQSAEKQMREKKAAIESAPAKRQEDKRILPVVRIP